MFSFSSPALFATIPVTPPLPVPWPWPNTWNQVQKHTPSHPTSVIGLLSIRDVHEWSATFCVACVAATYFGPAPVYPSFLLRPVERFVFCFGSTCISLALIQTCTWPAFCKQSLTLQSALPTLHALLHLDVKVPTPWNVVPSSAARHTWKTTPWFKQLTTETYTWHVIMANPSHNVLACVQDWVIPV